MNAEIDPSPGLREARPGRAQQRQLAQRNERQDGQRRLRRVAIEMPRDRNGTFEPQILAKHQTRFTGFDDKIISMYARGMTTREIQSHLKEIYGVEVSPALISQVTEAVIEEVKSVAEPAAGSDLSDRLPGCAVREDAARRAGGKPRGLCGDRGGSGRAEGCAGAVDSAQRGRQVLAAGADGV